MFPYTSDMEDFYPRELICQRSRTAAEAWSFHEDIVGKLANEEKDLPAEVLALYGEPGHIQPQLVDSDFAMDALVQLTEDMGGYDFDF